MRRIPPSTHPASRPRPVTTARRFNPTALTRIGERLLAHLDPDGNAAADTRRTHPHLVLTMGLNDLIDGLGTALLNTGGCLTASEARRLACDAYLIPMVLGSDSMPLDVGRQQRLAIAALREALTPRDRGCAFPSCDRPPRYCHAHHIVPGLDGGETKLPTRPLARCTTGKLPASGVIAGRIRGNALVHAGWGVVLIPECHPTPHGCDSPPALDAACTSTTRSAA